jgi:type I restriction enzyme S subunit
MSKWKKVSFGDVIIKRNKSPFQVSDAQNYGNYNFFTSGENILRHENYLVDGENLFLSTGGKALIKYYSGKANYSTDTYVISSSTIYPKYLYYFLQSIIDYINNNLFSGSGLKHLQKKDLNAMIIKYPTLPIQSRIAEILSTADKAIEDSEKLIAKYKRMKTGMMQDLLTKGIDENGNIRSEATHKFKDSPLGRIPVEWEVKRLEEVVNVRVSNVDKKSVEGERRVLLCNYMDVYSNRFIKQHNAYMEATASKSQIERFILEKNDVIITKDSETPDDIGVPAVVFEELTNVICGYHLALLKPKHNIDGIYLMYMLQLTLINKYLALNATGVTRFGLRISTIENTLILLPHIDEQRNISEKLVEIEKTLEIESETLSKLKRLKTGLMNDLLSGKVEVVDN